MKPLFCITLICTFLFANSSSFAQHNNTNLIKDVFSQTNQFRKEKGLKELALRNELNAIAQQHSIDMANGSVAFGHDGFDKRNTMAASMIKTIHSFAENVAYGPTSAQQVVTMWKNSSGHRRNMLGQYKYIGIGIAKDKQGRIFYTQVFAG